MQENHYYPFGMNHDGRWFGPQDPENRYTYNMIKNNKNINIYEAQFRSYDPVVGRWFQVDPMAEAASGWTPYRFSFNNPIYYSNPYGLFESRREARRYKCEHGITGRVSRNKDTEGSVTYSIDDNDNGKSVTYIDGLGIVESSIMMRYMVAAHLEIDRFGIYLSILQTI